MGILFLFSGCCVAAMLFYGALFKKPGMYPPKRLAKKRAGVFGAAALIFFCAGILFFLIGL